MPGPAEELEVKSFLVNLNGRPFGSSEGRFCGLALVPSAAGPTDPGNGLLGLDFSALTTPPGLPLNSLQWNSAGAFAGHPTYSRSGDGVVVSSAASTGFLTFKAAASNAATEGLIRTDQSHQAILLVREFFDSNDIAFLWRTGNALYVGADNVSGRRSSLVTLDASNGIVLAAQGVTKLSAGIANVSAAVPIVLANGQYLQAGTTAPAISGDVRGRNGFRLVARDGTDVNDIDLASVNIADVVVYGDSQAAGINLRTGAGATIALAQINGTDYLNVTSAAISALVPIMGESVAGSSPYGVHGGFSYTFALDADYVVLASQFRYQKAYFETGALGVLMRTVTWPAPATLATGYPKFVRNNTTATLRQSTGSGTVVDLLTNTGALLWFDSTGVSLQAAAL